MIFQKKGAPTILSLHCIWNQAPHNEMADLIYFNNRWFCALRELDPIYAEAKGIIRIISSWDGLNWTSQHLFSEPEVELSHPRLSLTPDGKLILLVEGITYNANNQYVSRQSRVSISRDGLSWPLLQTILRPNEWIWRCIWHQEKAFAITYYQDHPKAESLKGSVMVSGNGIDYSQLLPLNLPQDSNEGALGIIKGGVIGLFGRNKKGDNYAWAGLSQFPFYYWDWKVTQYHLEKFNLIVRPNEEMWVAGVLTAPTPYGTVKKIALLRFNWTHLLEPMLTLPGRGEEGHAGLFCQDQILWICYSSTHEEKNGIYLAKIQLTDEG